MSHYPPRLCLPCLAWSLPVQTTYNANLPWKKTLSADEHTQESARQECPLTEARRTSGIRPVPTSLAAILPPFSIWGSKLALIFKCFFHQGEHLECSLPRTPTSGLGPGKLWKESTVALVSYESQPLYPAGCATVLCVIQR